MTEKRYYAHKHLFQENKVHDTICPKFMNIDETVEHMNNQYWKYKQLKEENEHLKQFKDSVFCLIDKNIKEIKELFEEDMIDLNSYNSAMITLIGLKEELKGDIE